MLLSALLFELSGLMPSIPSGFQVNLYLLLFSKTWFVTGGISGILITLNAWLAALWQLLQVFVNRLKPDLNLPIFFSDIARFRLSSGGNIIGRGLMLGLSAQYC